MSLYKICLDKICLDKNIKITPLKNTHIGDEIALKRLNGYNINSNDIYKCVDKYDLNVDGCMSRKNMNTFHSINKSLKLFNIDIYNAYSILINKDKVYLQQNFKHIKGKKLCLSKEVIEDTIIYYTIYISHNKIIFNQCENTQYETNTIITFYIYINNKIYKIYHTNSIFDLESNGITVDTYIQNVDSLYINALV